MASVLCQFYLADSGYIQHLITVLRQAAGHGQKACVGKNHVGGEPRLVRESFSQASEHFEELTVMLFRTAFYSIRMYSILMKLSENLEFSPQYLPGFPGGEEASMLRVLRQEALPDKLTGKMKPLPLCVFQSNPVGRELVMPPVQNLLGL